MRLKASSMISEGNVDDIIVDQLEQQLAPSRVRRKGPKARLAFILEQAIADLREENVRIRMEVDRARFLNGCDIGEGDEDVTTCDKPIYRDLRQSLHSRHHDGPALCRLKVMSHRRQPFGVSRQNQRDIDAGPGGYRKTPQRQPSP